MEPIIKLSGISNDGRTNVWRVTCVCGHQFKPATTMFSISQVICPKCSKTYYVNYNLQAIKETQS